ncbi:MAG: hypothetical protein EBR86_02520 [Planctomycetia bacterium]|nr:hypothetical protein [Planctomycetia bacterium]
MTLILLAIVGVVFLLGAIALGIGHKGWNWGTVAAGWLVLLSALGAIFLIAMLGQRERSWRNIIKTYETNLARERDALVPAGGSTLRPDATQKSLAALGQERARWQRVRERINTWRGRHWDNAAFTPPAQGQPASLSIEGLESTTLNPGAEIYLFDRRAVEEGGRYLGAFRVEAVDRNVLSISPLSTPDAADARLWAEPRDAVDVYETLPVDRAMAFSRTLQPAGGEAAGEGGAAAPTDPGTGVMPGQRRIDPEAMLKHVEERLEQVRLHDQPLGGSPQPPGARDAAIAAENGAAAPPPDNDGGGTPTVVEDGSTASPAAEPAVAVADPEQSDEPPRGVRWARVTLAADHDYTWPDGTTSRFRKGETVPAFPVDQLARLRDSGADFTSAWIIPPGLYWATVTFTQSHTFPRLQGTPLEFPVGATAEFDLDTARALVAQGVATLGQVVYRRPLADGYTALRGAGSVDAAGARLPVSARGMVVIRQILRDDIASILSMTEQLGQARANAFNELELRQQELADLEADEVEWKADVEAAGKVAEAFALRTEAAGRELSKAEETIVALGRELTAASRELTATIDQTSPAPVVPAVPGR